MTDTENLPALPDNWCWTTIGEICDLINGKAFKPIEWSSHGIPIVRIQNLNNEESEFNYCDFQVEDKYYFNNGQLLFAWSGTPGTSFGAHIWNRGDAVLNQHIFKVNINESYTDKKFLMHVMNWNVTEYVRKAHGTAGLAHITKNKFETSFIPFPPIAEQHRIVQRIEELFTDLDAGVQALEKAKVQIKNYRQMVLKLTLQGKLIQQDPADEPALKLIETIRADLIKGKIDGKKLVSINTEENLFELPDSWKWIRLGEVLTFGPRNGYSPKPVKHVTNVRALTLTATTSGKFRDDCFKYIDEEIDANSHLWLEENDLLIQRGNTIEYVGVAAVYKGASNAFIYPDLMMKMKVHPKTKVDFLHMVINSKFSRKYFEKRATGTAGSMPKINQSTIVNLPIPLPPLAEQNRIVSEIERRFSVIDQIEKTIDQSMIQAEKLRQSILKKAFEGKLVSQDPNDEPASVLLEKIDKEKTELEASNKTKRKPTSKLKRKGIKEMKNSEADIQNIKLYEILSSSNSSLTPKELWQLSKLDIIDFYENLKVEVEKGRIIERRPNDIDVYLEIGE
ncbi:MAG: restriction endonuclease subunit S [Methanosarcina sp.]|nr:restriction endonuclease subunit S [Methanosarcina sp.]